MNKVKHLDSESGFTLVELIITATFVAAASAAIIGIFVTVNKLNKQARNLAIATALAQQKIETDRNQGYESIPANEDFTTSLPSNFGSPKSATASYSDLSPVQDGLKQLNIAIYWQEDKVTKHVQLSTLISQQGIGR
ncbi:MAG TPA: hypothetical protein VLF21_02430 [Candidatus Saccharimonadales bacterium]|nr:hypothetical protein [Candidatus Saccharimonadales bacterium]